MSGEVRIPIRGEIDARRAVLQTTQFSMDAGFEETPSRMIATAVSDASEVATKAPVEPWMLAIGGFGIVLGLATWGYKVMETVGKKITELTPSRGFAAELAAATTIVLASRLGIPVSTTHTLVGAVLGVGLARGIGAIDLRVVGSILVSWVATLPIAAGLAIFFY